MREGLVGKSRGDSGPLEIGIRRPSNFAGFFLALVDVNGVRFLLWVDQSCMITPDPTVGSRFRGDSTGCVLVDLLDQSRTRFGDQYDPHHAARHDDISGIQHIHVEIIQFVLDAYGLQFLAASGIVERERSQFIRGVVADEHRARARGKGRADGMFVIIPGLQLVILNQRLRRPILSNQLHLAPCGNNHK